MKYDKLLAVNNAESELKIKIAIQALADNSETGLHISDQGFVRGTGRARGFV